MAPCIGSADGTVMRSATPPGPPISPMQQAQRFAEGGVGLIRECHALLGDTFTLQLGSSMPPFVVLCNPEDVLQVFQNKEGAFSGGEGNRAALVHIPMGESFLMALEGKAHRAMQVMLGGIFKNAESDLAEGIRWRTELLVDSWQHPDVLYIREDIQRLALGRDLRVAVQRTADAPGTPGRRSDQTDAGYNRTGQRTQYGRRGAHVLAKT